MKFNKKKSSIKNVKFGKNVTIIEPVNLYGCEIKDNCFIGPFVEIQDNVKIGKNTRIQSHSFICSNVNIGENCFIGHGVCFINDRFKDNKLQRDKKKFLKTKIGSGVLIGSNSTILPVKIDSLAVIGAGSVVTKNCLKKKIYIGNPAKEIKKKR
jgi:acetyltransferase-like isoleucine patch superfamily enzyme